MQRNSEGYVDMTAFAAEAQMKRKARAYDVIRTIFHVARIAGFYVENITLADKGGNKYNSKELKRNV